MLRQVLALLIIGGVTGCTVQPTLPALDKTYSDLQTQKPIEDAKLQKTLQQGWWQKFNDPTLNTLIAQCIAANPNSQTALSAIREARAYQNKTDAGRYPSASLSAGYRHQYSNETEKQTGKYSLALDSQWEIDVFKQQQNASNSAKELFLAVQADYTDLIISLSAEFANTYFSLRQQQQLLQLVQSSLKNWQETQQLVEWQAMAGLQSQLAVEQAHRSYAQTAATIPEYQSAILQRQHQLAGLLGIGLEQLPKTLFLTQGLAPIPNIATDQLPLEILRQRPDVRAAEHRARSAAFQEAIAKANQYPSFILAGSLSNAASNLGDLLSVNTLIASLSASLSQTLFDHGQIKSDIEIKKEQALQALLSYRTTVLNALSEVQLAKSQMHNARQRLQKTLTALSLAKSEEELALLQYKSGQIAFSEVLTAQRIRLGLQQQELNAQQSLLEYTISFTKATMGDWAWQQMQVASSPQSEESENE
ncbi:multidrug efflux outer membrane protein OprN [Thiomicrorhabdus immobilis]|uniref:Multidrug efflux outer membrane protein OprN n=1 Tax=Thiomicrorhabdus immobilis TaxID=2791037 RepID=A0ABN6CWX1_9GAMM|nr:efflux transporter outer membrane subunit [Thiomicrorhabdus immobilis]BCN92352.1 multidrug efflux outer membrane protein OprN [Thiomicrorhabdus immobilis]